MPERKVSSSTQPSRSTVSRWIHDCRPPPNVTVPRRTNTASRRAKPTGGRVLASGPASAAMARRWQLGKLVPISLVHPRRHAALAQCLGEHLANDGLFVRIVDLIAPEAPADPCLRHALRVADGDSLVLEGEISAGGGTGVEVLVEPHVR